MVERRVEVGGPWFEDLKRGDVFEETPALTLHAGHAALHQALFGDRLRLPLDAGLCARVTGSERLLANPSLSTLLGLSGAEIGTLHDEGVVAGAR